MEEWARMLVTRNLTSEKSLFSQCRKDLLNVLYKDEEYSEELYSQVEWILRGYKNKLWETLSMNDKEDLPDNILDTVSDLLKKIKDVDGQKLKSFYRNIIKIVVDRGYHGPSEKGNLIDIGEFEDGKHWKFAIIQIGANYWLINDEWILVIPAIYKSMRKISDDAYYYEVTKKSHLGEIEWIIGLWGEKYFWGTSKRIASKLNLYPL